MSWKWSKFIFMTQSKENILLLNTTNTAIVSLKQTTYTRIEQLMSHALAIEDPEFSSLVDMNFIVDSQQDEIRELFEDLRHDWETDDTLKIVLLGTTSCNFCCNYCYENGIDRTHHLTKQVVDIMIEYVKNLIHGGVKIRRVILLLFGGEPTLNWDTLVYAGKKLHALCALLDISFKTDITTNGYLLTKEKIPILKELNCDTIQITLDGPQITHDQRRRLKNGEGTFNQIIQNMVDLLDSECVKSIDVRINIDRENISTIEELLRFLSEKFPPQRLNISLGVASKTISSSDDTNSAFSTKESAKHICELIALVEKYKFETPEFYSFDGICIAKSRYSFALTPDGKIYRCLSMVGREELSVGSIESANPHTDLKSFLQEEAYDWCVKQNCEFLPLCHTGCKFDAIVEHSSIFPPACKYEQYCAVNSYLLQRLDQKEGTI